MKERKTTAMWCAVIAAALAAVLLACTGFGAFRLLRGPIETADGKTLEAGSYVSVDLQHVLDVVGVERGASGAETAYYAAAPVGDIFVLIRFPASDAESMMALEAATDAYMQGESSSMPFHMIVAGEARELDDDAKEILVRWFNENAEWMSRAGILAAVEDYSIYLSPVGIEAGRAGNVSAGLAAAAGIAAAVLLAAAVVLFILAGTGKLDRQKNGKSGNRWPYV